MRLGQIFLTINMFMDHTASSPVLRKIDMASYAKPSELASQTSFESTGVVYSPATQQYNQMMKDAAQLEAMVAKNFDPQSYHINHGRKMQEMDGNTDSDDGGTNMTAIGAGTVVGGLIAIACIVVFLKKCSRDD